MATNISIPTYGFVNHILALNEGNWRRFFKPFITDSVQSGLATIAGANMTVYVSAGECRCGAVMGILDEMIALDIANGDSTYDRIDSVIVQYTYGEPSTLAVAIIQGTPSANPVPPTLTKVYDTLWQMEIAQILVPSGATSSSEFTITDKRVIYESIESIIDDNTESEERVWSSQKTHEEIVSLSTEIYDSLNTKADAITRTASGNIVTITDGADNLPVKELVVGIEPVQDLHGYDNPWPAGGGKNLVNFPSLLNVSYDGMTFTVNTDGTYTISGAPTSAYVTYITLTSIDDILVDGSEYVISQKAYESGCNLYVIEKNISTQTDTYHTAGSGTAKFTVDKSTYTYAILGNVSQSGWGNSSKTVKTGGQLEKASSATSWTPYSNICPITGHTQAVVTRSGKNLLDNAAFAVYANWSHSEFGGTYESNDANGTYVLPTVMGVTYTMTIQPVSTSDVPQYISLCKANANNKTLTSLVDRFTITSYSKSSISFTSDGSIYYIRMNAMETEESFNARIAKLSYEQLELGSTATAYEPYTCTSLTIDLGDTRYGGTLDVTSGVMTVDRIKKKIGNYAWSKNTGTHIFYSNIDRTIKPQTSIICSEYKSVSWEVEEDNMPDLSIKLGTAESNQQQICIRDDRYSNASIFKSDMSDVEFVYYLDEPTVMHLHPQQISTILGLNNIWANSGDILSLTYRADMKTYVDEQVAEANLKTRQMMTTVTTKMVAPSNLVVGDIVIVNDDLYKVINSNIASGEAMVVGTNVEKITLTEYIQSLI